MTNVFDLVGDFYAQDEEWNTVLRQSYAEDFLRMKSWQGCSDGELVELWDHITILCIYLGNSDKFLGDMTREDFIDCVGWCGRNVSDFLITAEHIEAFLTAMSDFYAHLRKKKIVIDDKAPAAALEKLLVDGRVQMLQPDGSFLPFYERSNLYSTPDLPAKVFLNIGDKMHGLMEALQTFFSDKKYHMDVERATFLYSSVAMGGAATELPGSEEYIHCFWDYFLFDYHLIGDDKTPLQHFYDDICGDAFSQSGQVSRDVILELLQAELVLFAVEEKTEDGFYVCRNILTGEQYFLGLPMDENVETKDFVFIGHVFYNQSMVMNFMRGMLLPPVIRKRFLETLEKMRAWYAVRCGGKLSWQEFIKRNSILVRHVAIMHAAYRVLDGFNYDSKQLDGFYEPQPLADDRVSLLISSILKPYAFSDNDIVLMRTLWADYLKAAGKQADDIHVPEMWAAGVIKSFIELNNVYNYQDQQLSNMCYGVPTDAMKRTAANIKTQLGIELHDPRYVNEEGMLLMVLS